VIPYRNNPISDGIIVVVGMGSCIVGLVGQLIPLAQPWLVLTRRTPTWVARIFYIALGIFLMWLGFSRMRSWLYT
jgi:hypothetical protein